MYKEYEVYVSLSQKNKLQRALQKQQKSPLSISVQPSGEKAMLLLTKNQILKVENGKRRQRNVTIRMSKKQVRVNIKYEGGFLSLLTALAGRVLPTILTGLASGAISGAVEKAIKGNGIYLQKGGHCYRAEPVEGDGLYLSPHQPRISTKGDGLFLKNGQHVYDGKGLLLGDNSPFKNIPILGMIL